MSDSPFKDGILAPSEFRSSLVLATAWPLLMDGIGCKLAAARARLQLSLREVEERSSRLALHWGNSAYRISASWLDRIERENRGFSATKLIVLAVIYGLRPEELLALCPPAAVNSTMLDQTPPPNVTLLLSGGPLDEHARLWLPDTLITDPAPEETTLLLANPGVMPTSYRRGVIGQRDGMLDSMVRPGSIVLIDTGKRTIAGRRQWTHEFDRPIYFLFTRAGYAAGFCELDHAAEWLTLVPHPLSYETSRRWRYKSEIDVIGTVAAIMARRTA